ncbi:hypothetical protein GOODEAATRI_016124 [Goodea atripinnis]|uniref:Uncharacterized protein n=1 Tax=Goodea atripinnis TaxID=208336 RepID=A0ABV0NMA3_9TELE
MPVRIMCTISFSTDDEPSRGYSKDGFDDYYKRIKQDYSDGGSQDYLDRCNQDNDCAEDEDEVSDGLWAVVFTTALSAFLYQVVDRAIYYRQYDHITMLDERVANNMTFPAITICNYNFIRKSQMSYSDLIFMGPLLGFEEGMAPGFPLAPEPDRPLGSRFSLDEFYNRTRHRIDDMLLDCSFRGLECGTENFREVNHCNN